MNLVLSCTPKIRKEIKIKNKSSSNNKNSSTKKICRTFFTRAKQSLTSNSKRTYHQLKDDVGDRTSMVKKSSQHDNSAAVGPEITRYEDESEIKSNIMYVESITPAKYDTNNNTRVNPESIEVERIVKDTSGVRGRDRTPDTEQNFLYFFIQSQIQSEEKIYMLDRSALPQSHEENGSEDKTTSFTSRNDSSIYTGTAVNGIDKSHGYNVTAPSFEGSIEVVLAQQASWLDAPSLAESDWDEENSINENDILEESLLVDSVRTSSFDVSSNTECKLNKNLQVTLDISAEEVDQCSIIVVNEYVDFDVKQSMALASSRKEALIQKHNSLVQKRLRVYWTTV